MEVSRHVNAFLLFSTIALLFLSKQRPDVYRAKTIPKVFFGVGDDATPLFPSVVGYLTCASVLYRPKQFRGL